MTTIQTPTDPLIKVIYLVYALHMLSALNGLLTPAFVVTAFLTGWPSIIALLLSYFWRADSANTYLYSHFNWLISTFWYAVIWIAIAVLLIATLVGMVVGVPMMLITGIWVIYRLCKGFLALHKQKAIY